MHDFTLKPKKHHTDYHIGTGNIACSQYDYPNASRADEGVGVSMMTIPFETLKTKSYHDTNFAPKAAPQIAVPVTTKWASWRLAFVSGVVQCQWMVQLSQQ